MSAEEQDALEGWAASLGGTSPTSADDHTTSQQTTQSKTENTENSKRDDKHTSSTDSGPGAIRTTYLLISMMTQRTGSISIWIRQRIGSMTGEIRQTPTNVPIAGDVMSQ